jgi:hypothetical protein
MTLPPLRAHGVEIPEIEAKRKEINENRRELREAQAHLRSLEGRMQQARDEDTQAAIVAKRQGAKDPGPKAEKKLQGEIEKARREVRVLEGISHELAYEASDLLAEHAETILEGLMGTLQEHNSAQLEALARVDAARSARAQLANTLSRVRAVIEEEEPLPGPAGDRMEVFNFNLQNLMRVEEPQIQRVLAHLRAESGDTRQRDQIVAQEDVMADENNVVDLTLESARPEGFDYFKIRRAARLAGVDVDEAVRAAQANGG